MKLFKSFLPTLIAVISTTLFSCSDDKDPAPAPEVSVSATELSFDAYENLSRTLTVASNVDYTIYSESTWCIIEPIEGGSASKQDYTVTCEMNYESEVRSTSIVIEASGIELARIAVSQAAPEEITPLTVDMVHDALGIGWNLGNQLDSFIDGGVADETSWGNPVVGQSVFDAVKRAGFTSVRIPVTWMGHVGPAPDYVVEEAWLDRVADVVSYAENAGLKAIINIHHDGADSNYWLNIKRAATDEAFNEEVENQLAAIWSQVAEKFADKGEFLVFESMNEIHDGGWGWGDNRKDGGKQYRIFNHWQQVFVDAVRATGKRNSARWLGVPAYCTNIDLGANLIVPEDPSERVMVAVHCYEPYDFTLGATYSEWGHTGASGKKVKNSDEKTLVAEFDKVVNRWTSKGIPAYIGEFGCVHRSDERSEAFRKYYLEYFAKAASDRRIPILYWDNGYSGEGAEMSGLFNRQDGTFFNNAEEVVGAMTRGFFSSSYTLDDVYASAPK